MGHEALENCCQLHERVYIYYVVDGYIAKLCIWDDIDCPVVEVHGKTILEALSKLNDFCVGKSLADIRKMRVL